MRREIITTSDGSKTIHLPDWDESYHSKHGAVQEAYHVFIKNGLRLFDNRSINILEIGFGTGLNAIITLIEAEKQNLKVNYTGIEAYPVSVEEALEMNYLQSLDAIEKLPLFEKMHQFPFAEQFKLSDNFNFEKRNIFFNEIDDINSFDLIYFDAFGFRVQPELWSTEIFEKMFHALKDKGVLVTYAARGVVKRSMQEVGFSVEKLAGPPGKREMMRAFKM
ncbi:tRNA (5-methylaminomethyl-2-thiouridine)(34)-methyltransferase MnmD [Flavobacterium ardleyense]|uniref:tRNA (5-methylaminomethyl-2-thiouridine)(34)-methyltransferase MnmD n=1 Tax=Flavobacterium ardleyense TaxID=2038737 RepID=UPI00298CC309|nr:tRNA (5-methylaminomethyl-2-thiouridine)(34)-methyltransferase MnmD [Flavobacterium ardleyense]